MREGRKVAGLGKRQPDCRGRLSSRSREVVRLIFLEKCIGAFDALSITDVRRMGMNTTIKSAIAACGLLAAVSMPLTAGTDTSFFSGKESYGSIGGFTQDNVYLEVSAFKVTAMSRSNKTNSPGASIFGYFVDESGCSWNGSGSTDTIQFKATGSPNSIPETVTASGSVSITWESYCSSLTTPPSPIPEDTVRFEMNLSALTDQGSSNWGTSHTEYADIRINSHFNQKQAPAAVNDSSFISSNFGSVTISSAYVGQSKWFDVEITR